MLDKLLADTDKKMVLALDYMGEELKKIRTGRANSSLVEDIRVSYYGSTLSMKEMATITTPEPGMIALKPFDKNAIGDTEMAIRNADLGINPVNDGNFIRLHLPALNEERRVELSKQVKKIGEESKVSIRTIRGEAWSQVQSLVKSNDATEDDKYKMEKKLNELTAKKDVEIDHIVSAKEAEIMKI